MLLGILGSDDTDDVDRVVRLASKDDWGIERDHGEPHLEHALRRLGVSKGHARGQHEVRTILIEYGQHLDDVVLGDVSLVNEHIRGLLDSIATVGRVHPEAQVFVVELVYHGHLAFVAFCDMHGRDTAEEGGRRAVHC